MRLCRLGGGDGDGDCAGLQRSARLGRRAGTRLGCRDQHGIGCGLGRAMQAMYVCHATRKTKERFDEKGGGTHVGTTARVRICPKRAL